MENVFPLELHYYNVKLILEFSLLFGISYLPLKIKREVISNHQETTA